MIFLLLALLLKVEEVHFVGCKHTEPEKLLLCIRTKVGESFSREHTKEDIKKLYATGKFEDIKVFLRKLKDGVAVLYKVKEQPYIKEIKFFDHSPIKEKKLKEVLGLEEGVLNIHKLREGKEKVATLYREKGYLNVCIRHRVERGRLCIKIEKGKKLLVKSVNFAPHSIFMLQRMKWALPFFPEFERDAFLKKMIKTKEGAPFILEMAQNDVQRILKAYWNKGHMEARCRYKKEITEEGVDVHFLIKEGRRFKVGKIDVMGNKAVSSHRILKLLKTKEGDYYCHEKFLNDQRRIYLHYGRLGYVEMRMGVKTDVEQNRMHILLCIDEGRRCFVQKIILLGNKKTEDSVIRKNILLKEGEVLDIEKLGETRTKLLQLGFFSSVDVKIEEGSKEGGKILMFFFKERRTGSLNVGFGYSSKYKMFGTLSVSEVNLFGKGIYVEGKAEYGKRRLDYSFTLLHPYLGKDYEAGFFLKNTKYRREYYTIHTRGGGIKLGKRIGTFNKLTLSYQREKVSFPQIEEENLIQKLKEREGVTSSLAISFLRDRRDEAVFPRRGYKLNVNAQFAGGRLGADVHFTKKEVELCLYFPSFADCAIASRLCAGTITAGARDDYKFYIGGQESVRGYEEEQICIRKDGKVAGGNAFFTINLEHRFFVKEGFYLLLFFDAGAVAEKASELLSEIWSSAGVGARLETPIGLLKFDWGYPFRGDGGRLHFGFGPSF